MFDHWKLTSASGLLCLIVGLPASAAELPSLRTVGNWSCSAVACHGQTDPRPVAAMWQNAVPLWMRSDPHARSTATIWSDEFHTILVRMGAATEQGWDQQVYARCARCHDPQFSPRSPPRAEDSTFLSASQIEPRGVGCESCHGPAERWLARHYQRGRTASQLQTLGMTHTKNLTVRGQVCAACHVGSEQQDMNHDMIAAGHPPLRFELASYHDRLPKHWPAAAERQATSDFQIQLWGAGQRAVTDASLQLLHGRATRAAASGDTSVEPGSNPGGLTPWPEFAEFSCLSCHQRLRTADQFHALQATSMPATVVPGRPRWNPWAAAFSLEQTTGSTAPDESLGSPFTASWRSLRERMESLSATDAEAIQQMTRVARRHLASESPATAFLPPAHTAGERPEGGRMVGESRPVSLDPDDLVRAVQQTASRAESWESLCQVFLALQAATRAEHDRRAPGGRLPAPSADLESIRWSLAFAAHADVPRGLLAPSEREQLDRPGDLPPQVRILTLVEVRELALQLAEQLERSLSPSPSNPERSRP